MAYFPEGQSMHISFCPSLRLRLNRNCPGLQIVPPRLSKYTTNNETPSVRIKTLRMGFLLKDEIEFSSKPLDSIAHETASSSF